MVETRSSLTPQVDRKALAKSRRGRRSNRCGVRGLCLRDPGRKVLDQACNQGDDEDVKDCAEDCHGDAQAT